MGTPTPDRENYQMAPQNDVEKAKQVDEEETGGWTGLGKEELLQVADTPAWNWTRNVLLILFWMTWVAMLIAAIWIVVTVPRCPDVEWWEKSVVYQVQPRSFYDSGSDGVGDLKGIKEKISYLEELQVKILYLNSIFAQDNGTNPLPGNHIVDFMKVDEILGSKADLEDLIAAATEASIKVIIEFIPNHSSDQHPWFISSKANATAPEANFYIWSDSPGSETMGDGQSAWTEVDGRGWYYHSMHPSLPDFNYNNEDLRKQITDAMDYWLDMGVDGMVITNVNSVVDTDASSRRRRQVGNDTVTLAPTEAATTAGDETTGAATREPATNKPAMDGTEEPKAEPVTYAVLEDDTVLEDDKIVQDRIEEWRKVFTANSYLGKYRLLVTSGADSKKSAVTQYGNENRLLADFPLNTLFLDEITDTPSGKNISNFIVEWMKAKEMVDEKTGKRWNSWLVSNQDVKRVATRCSSALVNALNTLLLTLPGTPFVMYGDELGMQDAEGAMFPQLSPMSWSAGINASFTTGTPWNGLDSNYKTNNVEELSKEPKSSLNLFKSLVTVHMEPPVVAGKYDLITSTEKGIAYLRKLEDWPTHLVVINFGNTEEEFVFPSNKVPEKSEVVFSTNDKFMEGEELNAQEINVAGQQAVIFKFKPLQ